MHPTSADPRTEDAADSSPAPTTCPRSPADRLVKLVWVLIAILGVYQTLGIWGLEADPDEHQMAAAAYAMSLGEKLYSEVWDNHGPLHTYAMALAFDWLKPSSHSILYLFRAWSLLCQAGVAVALFVWARRSRVFESPPETRLFPALSVFLLLLNQTFSAKGLEIRADAPFMFLWMAAFAMWHEAHATNCPRRWLISGLILGACFWFSLKTMSLGLAAGLMFMTAMALRRRISIMPMVYFGIGTAVAPAMMLAGLGLAGNLDAFLNSFLGQNLDREPAPISAGLDELFGSDMISAVCLIAVAAALAWRARRREVPPAITLAAAAAAFLVFQFVCLLPTKHSQSLLPVAPLMAGLAAWAATDLLARVTRPSAHRWAMGACAALTVYHLIHMDYHKLELVENVRKQDWRASAIEPGAWLQEGEGVPLFFPRPTKYKAFVRTLRDRSEAGTLDLGIEAGLAARDVKYVILDRRITDVGKPLRKYLAEHYIPMKRRKFLIAGKVIRASAEGRANFQIDIAGDYYWRAASGDASITVDGQEIAGPGPIRLEDGAHEVRWSGAAPVVFGQLPPENWGRWEGLLEEEYPSDQKLDEEEALFWNPK